MSWLSRHSPPVEQAHNGISVEFKIRVQDKVFIYGFLQTLSCAKQDDDRLCLDLS